MKLPDPLKRDPREGAVLAALVRTPGWLPGVPASGVLHWDGSSPYSLPSVAAGIWEASTADYTQRPVLLPLADNRATCCESRQSPRRCSKVGNK